MKKNCYKRKDGRWHFIKQYNGMKYYAIANTYRELLEKIKNIKPKQIKTLKRPKNKTLTFNQYFSIYIESFVKTKGLKEKTISSWIEKFRNYIEPYFKRMPLESITAETIQAFLGTISKERTQEIIYQRIVKVLQKAYITNKIKKDITLGIEKPKRSNIEERPPLTYDEQVLLLEKLKESKHRAFYMFSLVIGSRREETIQFNKLTDINEGKLEITIHGVKSDKKDTTRKVHTTKQFIDYLKENMPGNTFTHSEGYYTKNFGDILKALKINNCLHGLRHTCAANLYFLGANDKYRQMQLGHKSIVTTNDVYTNIKENISKAALRGLYGELYPSFD